MLRSKVASALNKGYAHNGVIQTSSGGTLQPPSTPGDDYAGNVELSFASSTPRQLGTSYKRYASPPILPQNIASDIHPSINCSQPRQVFALCNVCVPLLNHWIGPELSYIPYHRARILLLPAGHWHLRRRPQHNRGSRQLPNCGCRCRVSADPLLLRLQSPQCRRPRVRDDALPDEGEEDEEQDRKARLDTCLQVP